LNGIEILSVLIVVGLLFLLSIRIRTRISTVILTLIIALLLLTLISVGKLAMTLFGAVVFLAALVVLLVLISFRYSQRSSNYIAVRPAYFRKS